MWKRKMGRVLLAGLLSLVLLAGQTPAGAASDTIRVALFIDNGQGYRGVVPAVTLTAEGGLEVSMRAQEGTAKIPSLGGETARVRVDEFYVQAVETGDLTRAQQAAQQLSQRKIDASIQLAELGGKRVYQVVSGTYDTYQAAIAQARAIEQATGQPSAVKGPMRLEAGRFTSLNEALDWQAAFASANIPAYPVFLQEGRKLSYAVWIGDEVSKEAAQKLARKASAEFPGFTFREASSPSYVVMKKDLIGSAGVWKYVLSPKTTLEAKSAKDGSRSLIGVEERGQRKYRGSIELSEYKGNLAVINELKMEEYLYSVVGSEMAPGWPLEALKAQAVLARTRAVAQGNKYGIANLSDTVYEQAYYGFEKESRDTREAVDETEGEVIFYRGKVAEALYYSNAGGMTAAGEEVWGNDVPYLRSIRSDDSEPAKKAARWYQVSLADGTIGYLRSDLVEAFDSANSLGFREGVVQTANSNLRSGPSTAYHRVLTTLPAGTAVTIVREVAEENAYSWTRGPYTAEEVTAMINASQERNKGPRISGVVETLRVTERGESGRVIEMEANGQPLKVSSPDAHRSIFQQGGAALRSTKFDVIEMGSVTVLGADGKQTNYPKHSSLMAVGADSYGAMPANGYQDQYLILGAENAIRTASKQQMFLFEGTGFGHGLGVSQYGAKAMAENGYDYREILQHYYQDVSIEKY
ncbi:SpoIID/LytB domain-containing protein [Brevibacillus composti]|uniref:SpoIID/LytB domain-containing protein n=1 Tax=Brevibacillus composti TaxID=2796470 RepID=A0A7T5EIP9_9BACL|nr:SpoIID/LytB domain-containing protein [Brevibacillus composti]QQE73265.1 SpoIID/LytB domain-containing protein [Brevibacillus composti]QUO40346.1 SpoIID/LytB domain-containing protein [Brevibacillus composti]